MKNKEDLRIFLVSNMYPSRQLARYGVFVKNFEEQLAILGCKFPHKAVLKDTPLVTVVGKVRKYLRLYAQILWQGIMHRNSYDLIYVHYPLHMALALYVVSFFKKALILNFHGSDLAKDNLVKALLFPVQKLLVKRASMVVVPSEYFKEKLIALMGIKPEKVTVSPSGGIDLQRFRTLQQEEAEELKVDLSIPKHTFFIGFVGTFIPRKAWDVFLEALNILKTQKKIDFRVLMVGDGVDLPKIEKRINQLDIQEEMIIHHSMPQEALAKMFASFDVFVFPSNAESLGLVGLEAMACGTPVIASDLEVFKGYVSPEENGLLFRKGSPQDLADKLEKYYFLNAEEKKGLYTSALNTARQYDTELVAKKLYKRLQEEIFR